MRAYNDWPADDAYQRRVKVVVHTTPKVCHLTWPVVMRSDPDSDLEYAYRRLVRHIAETWLGGESPRHVLREWFVHRRVANSDTKIRLAQVLKRLYDAIQTDLAATPPTLHPVSDPLCVPPRDWPMYLVPATWNTDD